MRNAALALAIAGALGGQTFKSGVDAVRVDVLVTDGNVPLAGLTARDFELRDNGVVQQIDAVGLEDVPVSMMLALDTSYSVRGPALDDLKRAANAALEPLAPEDRVALITFSEAWKLRADWTADRDLVRRAIDATTAGGGTALWDATYAAITMRDAGITRRSLVVLFSDGDDTASWLPHTAILDRARRSDAVVYGVSLEAGDEPRGRLLFRSGIRLSDADPVAPETILPQLADTTGGRDFRMASSGDIAGVFRRIVSEFRTRYLLTYVPRNVAADGWHTIDVELRTRRGQVRARRGYLR